MSIKPIFIPALATLLFFHQSAFAQEPGDVTKGEVVFKKCMVCHRIGPDAAILIGPVLTGVIGRPAGTYPGFVYSPLMKAAGENGLVWSEELIKEYLPDPPAFLKKFLTDKGKPTLAAGLSKMLFKLPSEQERDDVVAYIETFAPLAPK
jgi:cytochrome c